MEKWRLIAVIALLTLSLIDIVCTYYYVHKYKEWQPDKPYNMIERNPLLVFLWNNLGLLFGTIVGAIIIWTLIFIIVKTAHPIIIGILAFSLSYALFNHSKNINLLIKLIEKYPTGHLPEKIFGKVTGNN